MTKFAINKQVMKSAPNSNVDKKHTGPNFGANPVQNSGDVLTATNQS